MVLTCTVLPFTLEVSEMVTFALPFHQHFHVHCLDLSFPFQVRRPLLLSLSVTHIAIRIATSIALVIAINFSMKLTDEVSIQAKQESAYLLDSRVFPKKEICHDVLIDTVRTRTNRLLVRTL